jgi:putative glutamine amidotransferase
MRFLITGGTLNPLKDDYLTALAAYGHTGEIIYPGETVNCQLSTVNCHDALLLPGGGDIDPARFGSVPLENGGEVFDIPRDGLEFRLFEMFYAAKKPVIGICRGMQVINVALGGSIWQDLPLQCGLSHAAPDGAEPMTHTVVFTDGTQMEVNSFHHQAVRKPGRGLTVTARSADGMPEALEGNLIRAVQWHPEKTGCPGFEWLLGQGRQMPPA